MGNLPPPFHRFDLIFHTARPNFERSRLPKALPPEIEIVEAIRRDFRISDIEINDPSPLFPPLDG